ncbi:glycoside hydrolase family 25 protein [Corynebacterium endometrii]|uniref:Lysozyme M1 n=1 Tax=Corynebacterium endometrii TaxID=2488819 RepID=A0A4P7QH02_9CORY|nr:glycoside hydrolase family 25 protein [Corynebacterium endometrii]QCB28266.1 Lysozyme M1 precursor [Corynebacterium endometrii]
MFKPKGLLSALTALVASAALLFTAQAAPQARALTIGAPSGVDVAGHQHPGGAPINWKTVRADGQSFAFVKASEGIGWTNEFFEEDARGADAAGMKVGSYHYARPASDPRAQAATYAAQIARVPHHSLPPVLDLEVSEGKSPRELIAWTRAFTDELKALTGRTPMIYTYRYFWTDHMANTTQFSEYPLWLAAYQAQAPEPVGGWSKLAFWQRSESGRVNGVTGPVDMNLFNGNDAQLASFAAGNYGNFGGVLNGLVVPGAPDLGEDASLLIGAILALGVGAAAAPAIIEAAKESGLGAQAAGELARFVEDLNAAGELPISELQAMAAGDSTVGDLAILLDNAAHLGGVDSELTLTAAQVDKVANAARGAGVDLPAIDSRAVADALSHAATGR